MSVVGFLLLALLAAADLTGVLRMLREPGADWQLTVAAHLLVAVLSGPALLLAIPSAADDRPILGALGVLLGLFVPGFGPLGLALAQLVGFGTRRRWTAQSWVLLDDEPEVLGERARQRRARRHLAAKAMAAAQRERFAGVAEQRVEDLLQASRLGGRNAVLFLKLGLRDPFEEVRLFAFSRLERLRDDFTANIRQLRAKLKSEANGGHPRTHLSLAQAHWEFAYLGLGEGAALDRALDDAEEHAAKAAPASGGSHAAAEFLLGRVLLAKRCYDRAKSAFERAAQSGYPRARLLPYLAECAFCRRRFDEVRACVRELDASGTPLFLKPMVEFWR